VTLGDRVRKANWLLLALALALTALGVSTVSTAAEGHETGWAWLQVRWAVVGIAATFLVIAVPYRRIVQARHVLYAAGVLGLLLVLARGSGKSAGRWLEIGSFRLQPSEFMKLVLVVALAGYVRYEQRYKTFRGLATPFALTMLPVLLVMKQPDLGTALLLVPILFVLLFAAGARLSHLGAVAMCGVLAAVAMYAIPGLLHDYQKRRVETFLGLGGDSRVEQRMRAAQDHQLERGLMAMAAGGFTGAPSDEGGVEEAVAYLPERHTDFVFPVFAAAHGFLGVTGLFALYFVFLAVLLATATKVREPSGRMLVVGVFTLFAAQVVVNLGMTVGLLPVVGVTLPFFSYGGSSLLTSYLALGIVLNVGIDPPLEFGRGDFD
jgi:rod shape determining protein RodA